jgi:hypothetical protein
MFIVIQFCNNQLTGSLPFFLDNWISNSNANITNNKKPAQIHNQSNRPHTITKLNDNKHGQYNSRVKDPVIKKEG